MGKGKVEIATTGQVGDNPRFLCVAGADSAFVCADLEEEVTDTLDLVREFHKAFNIPVADRPYMPRPMPAWSQLDHL